MKRCGLKVALYLGAATLMLGIGGRQLRAGEATDVRSPEQIRSVVEGLHKKDVAWREVQWRTCLIEGLHESRQAGKPLLLWVFIDRPIDDERC